MTAVDDPLSLVFAGHADDVLLREGMVDELGHVTLVNGGRCARVTQAAFDTTLTPGADWLSAEDCGNAAIEVCQPATNTCGPPECGEFLGCPENRPVCMSQYHESFSGACYAVCDPTATSGCAAGEDCVQLGVDPTFGICKHIGSGAVGASCEPEDNSTSCVDEALCNGDTSTCTRQCQMFAATPGCQAGASCTVVLYSNSID